MDALECWDLESGMEGKSAVTPEVVFYEDLAPQGFSPRKLEEAWLPPARGPPAGSAGLGQHAGGQLRACWRDVAAGQPPGVKMCATSAKADPSGQTGAAKEGSGAPLQVGRSTASWPCSPTPRCAPKRSERRFPTKTRTPHSQWLCHDSQKVEAIQMSMHR